MAYFRLADTVDTPETLFKTVGVPGQIIIDHQMCALQVDALASGIGCNQHLHTYILCKCFLRFSALFAPHPSMDSHYSLFAPQHSANTLSQVVERISVLSKDH